MNVREVLQPMVTVDDHGCNMIDADQIAPMIERALRAAYWAGEVEHRPPGHLYKLSMEARHPKVHPFSDRGVTAGVAAIGVTP